MLFLEENFHRHFKILQSSEQKITPIFLSSLLPEFFCYCLLPNFLTFDKCALLGYYAGIIVKFLQSFDTNRSGLTSSVKPKVINPR